MTYRFSLLFALAIFALPLMAPGGNFAAAQDSGETAKADGEAQIEQAEKQQSWLSNIWVNDAGGFMIGDPDAPVTITEYVSYTCGHCANFEINDTPKLKSEYVDSGKARFEIRSLTLNPVDKTVAMLARCGADNTFFERHNYWMKSQKKWLGATSRLSEKTRKLVSVGPSSLSMVAIYEDMGLSEYAVQSGLSDEQARKCLKNGQAYQTLDDMRALALAQLNVTGTPSFLVDGRLAQGVHGFDQLKAFLKDK